jgi:hypothetical protein
MIYDRLIKWDSTLEIIYSIINIMIVVIYTTVPLLITAYLRSNIKKFRKKSFKQGWSELIQDLTHKHKSSTNFIAIFCYRRLTLILLIILLPD